MPSRDETLAVVTALTAALAAALLAVILALAPLRGAAGPDPACAEWTDGCVVCQRQADGSAACSTPGIACQRALLRCLRKG